MVIDGIWLFFGFIFSVSLLLYSVASIYFTEKVYRSRRKVISRATKNLFNSISIIVLIASIISMVVIIVESIGMLLGW